MTRFRVTSEGRGRVAELERRMRIIRLAVPTAGQMRGSSLSSMTAARAKPMRTQQLVEVDLTASSRTADKFVMSSERDTVTLRPGDFVTAFQSDARLHSPESLTDPAAVGADRFAQFARPAIDFEIGSEAAGQRPPTYRVVDVSGRVTEYTSGAGRGVGDGLSLIKVGEPRATDGTDFQRDLRVPDHLMAHHRRAKTTRRAALQRILGRRVQRLFPLVRPRVRQGDNTAKDLDGELTSVQASLRSSETDLDMFVAEVQDLEERVYKFVFDGVKNNLLIKAQKEAVAYAERGCRGYPFADLAPQVAHERVRLFAGGVRLAFDGTLGTRRDDKDLLTDWAILAGIYDGEVLAWQSAVNDMGGPNNVLAHMMENAFFLPGIIPTAEVMRILGDRNRFFDAVKYMAREEFGWDSSAGGKKNFARLFGLFEPQFQYNIHRLDDEGNVAAGDLILMAFRYHHKHEPFPRGPLEFYGLSMTLSPLGGVKAATEGLMRDVLGVAIDDFYDISYRIRMARRRDEAGRYMIGKALEAARNRERLIEVLHYVGRSHFGWVEGAKESVNRQRLTDMKSRPEHFFLDKRFPIDSTGLVEMTGEALLKAFTQNEWSIQRPESPQLSGDYVLHLLGGRSAGIVLMKHIIFGLPPTKQQSKSYYPRWDKVPEVKIDPERHG